MSKLSTDQQVKVLHRHGDRVVVAVSPEGTELYALVSTPTVDSIQAIPIG